MLTYYFQVVLHYSPLRAGLAFLPLTAAVSASAYGLGSRLLPLVAPRTLIVPGLLVAAAGLTLLSRLDASSGYLTVILPAQVLLGAGMGCVFTPAISVATSGVDPRDAGVAAAAANTAMQIGGSVGTAVLNTVAITATETYPATHAASPAAATEALVHGYATATTCAAALLASVALAAAALLNSPRPGPRPPVTASRRAPSEAVG
ncbi:MAG: MFS transporter [Actinomycetes bacterium]